MTLARLLLATVLLCSLPAFTQDQKTGAAQIPGNRDSASAVSSAATASEPWKIIPNPPSDLNSDSMDRMRLDRFRVDTGRSKLEGKTSTLVMGLDGPLDDDAICYTMRSYVVARDSKNSDSTHPAGYSTCQRASKYRLKTTVGGPVQLER